MIALPLVFNEVRVPTEVIFGCAAVVNVPVNREAPMVPEFAYTFPAVAFPVTASDVSVPTDVILGCAAVVTVPAVVAALTVPVTLAPVIELRDEPLPLTLVNTPFVAPILPTLALPVTANEVNVPTLVILGCAAVVTVPAVVAAPVSAPTNVVDVTLVSPVTVVVVVPSAKVVFPKITFEFARRA
jgi:hypothetical protein